jgi:hypothetical protein
MIPRYLGNQLPNGGMHLADRREQQISRFLILGAVGHGLSPTPAESPFNSTTHHDTRAGAGKYCLDELRSLFFSLLAVRACCGPSG